MHRNFVFHENYYAVNFLYFCNVNNVYLFKGHLPSATQNKYLLTVVDEYSRFPFAIPCPDINSSTVIKSLDIIFALSGMPNYIHSDRGKSFMSHKLKNHFYGRGIASSKSTPYHCIGNGQVERYNGIIWKNIKLALHTQSFYSTTGVCTSRCSSLSDLYFRQQRTLHHMIGSSVFLVVLLMVPVHLRGWHQGPCYFADLFVQLKPTILFMK